jgi:hypothetical protein
MITADRNSVIITIRKDWLDKKSKTDEAANGLTRLLVGGPKDDSGYPEIRIDPDLAMSIVKAAETSILLHPREQAQ